MSNHTPKDASHKCSNNDYGGENYGNANYKAWGRTTEQR